MPSQVSPTFHSLPANLSAYGQTGIGGGPSAQAKIDQANFIEAQTAGDTAMASAANNRQKAMNAVEAARLDAEMEAANAVKNRHSKITF